MALRDLEAFIRQLMSNFDSTQDTNPGSPFDSSVIQPVLRRVGPDPFSVDLPTFLNARLTQAYPDMAISEGDALTDLIVKANTLLWDPIVREVARIKRGQSARDPASLTEEEAEALGANLFADRAQGDFARGTVRIYFAQAQNVSVSPVNFVTSRSGLHFFPTETQSIRVEEMLLNVDENGLFYFDLTVIAEQPGASYNLGPNELVSIANLDAAVQVKNLRKFDGGDEAQTSAEFIDQVRQSLTERSLVTLRGIVAKLTTAFPEITRLNVVGFNDPEMQRDVIQGGGLGTIAVAGIAGQTVSDTVNGALTKRFMSADAGLDFTTSIGPAKTTPSGVVLTVFGAFGGGDVARDLTVTRVVSADTIEVENPEMVYGLTSLRWTIRRRELTLSGIPGGILFPDSPSGTVTIPDDEVHIGGMVDTHVRGSSFDLGSLVIDNLSDDENEVEGFEFDFTSTTTGIITDLVLGSNYEVGDATYELLARAGRDALTLQIVNGVNAKVYRILAVNQAGASPVVTVDPVFTSSVAANARWRIFDAIDVALYDIKETRVTGNDMSTAQNFDVVTTSGAVDFDAMGVAEGDILRLLNGPDAGDYRVSEAPLAPGFTSLRVDASFTSSQSNLRYAVFRANTAGNIQRPFIRISSIELLDSSSQPVGTTIPYARPVDTQSNAFQNSARGVKHDVRDAVLGLVSQPVGAGFLVGGLSLNLVTPLGNVTVTFSAGPSLSRAQVVSELNAAILSQVGEPQAAVLVGVDRVGIRPFGVGGVVTTNGNPDAVTALFGADEQFTTRDIRSATITQVYEWSTISPLIDLQTGLDIVQFLDGNQVGFVPGPYVNVETAVFPAGQPSRALQVAGLTTVFSPEAGVRLQVGARSIGSARLFFLDPTSFEARYNETFFELQTESGLIRFTPDPTLDHQRIPAPPNGDKPMDGASADGSPLFTSASQDFILSSAQAGDKLVIDYHPIAGTAVLLDPVPGLVNLTLIFSIDGSPDKTLVFIRDDVTLASTEVTRQGVADQINAAAGIDIAKITGSNTLEFEADASIVIRGSGTANTLILNGLATTASTFVGVNQDNDSPHKGEWIIQSVNSQTQVQLVDNLNAQLGEPFTTPFTRQQFKVFRSGVQRVSTSEMRENVASAGLFFVDVELVSEGTGDLWNIDAGEQLSATGFRSDGYYLTTEDSNLTFSVLERPRLVISKTILEEGVDDDPINATQLAGQNLLISYEWSSLVEDAQNFISSDTERVVNSNPLSRHLIPHFVRFDATYVGGDKEEVVVPDVEDYITQIAPAEALESSDVQKILSDHGATSIDNPIDLIAIVHNVDRTITAARSQNRLTTGRLAAFIPDLLNIKRNIT